MTDLAKILSDLIDILSDYEASNDSWDFDESGERLEVGDTFDCFPVNKLGFAVYKLKPGNEAILSGEQRYHNVKRLLEAAEQYMGDDCTHISFHAVWKTYATEKFAVIQTFSI